MSRTYLFRRLGLSVAVALFLSCEPDGGERAPSIRVTSPAGGEVWYEEEAHDITWASNRVAGTVDIAYSLDGNEWADIATGEENDGTCSWAVPAAASAQTVCVRVQSESGTPSAVSQAFTVIARSIAVTAPSAGESLTADAAFDVEWTSAGTMAGIDLVYSTDGWTWTDIATGEADDGLHTWTVPAALAGGSVWLRVAESDGSPQDVAGEFPVVAAGTNAITVTSPNGGEVLPAGEVWSITWTYAGSMGDVNVSYDDPVLGWTLIDTVPAAQGACDWTVPLPAAGNPSSIMVEEVVGAAFDVSDAQFNIVAPGERTVGLTYPNGGELLFAGMVRDITWTSSGDVPTVDLYLSTDWAAASEPTAIALGVENTGGYTWRVPDGIWSSGCTVQLRAESGEPADSSDDYFHISGGPDAYEADDDYTTATLVGIDGGPQVHTFHTLADEDWVKMDVAGAPVTCYVLTSDLGLATETSVELYDTDGTTLIASDVSSGFAGASLIAYDFTSDGTYYVRVAENTGAVGSYGVEVASADPLAADAYEPDDDAASASLIQANGEAQVHNFHTGSDVDYVRIMVGSTSAVYVIETYDEADRTDPALTLYDLDGATQLAYSDYSGEGNSARIRYQFSTPGTYFVKVEELNARPGGYSLRVNKYDLDVTSPAAGSTFVVGDACRIEWSPAGQFGTLDILYGVTGVVTLTSDDGAYVWTIPDAVGGTQRKFKVSLPGVADWFSGRISIEPKSITVGAPAGGEVMTVGDTFDVTWTSVGTVGNVEVGYSFDGAAVAGTLATDEADDGSFSWTLEAASIGAQVWIIIDAADGSASGVSGMFSVVDAGGTALNVSWPNGGEALFADRQVELLWNSTGLAGTVDLSYSTDGTTFTGIAAGETDDGSCSWTVPSGIASANCLIRVEETGGAGLQDVSDAAFAISAGPDAYEVDDETASAKPIEIGFTPQAHNLHRVGDLDWVSFTVDYWCGVTIETLNLSVEADTVIHLYDAAGTQIATNDDYVGQKRSRLDRWLDPGTYYVRVKGKAAAPLGSYELRVRILESEFEWITPAGGEVWTVGETRELSWTSSGPETQISIYYRVDWNPRVLIASGQPWTGTYSWTIPAGAAGGSVCVETTYATWIHYSARFSVMPSSGDYILVTAPAGADVLAPGTAHEMRWQSPAAVTNVDIEYCLDYEWDSTWVTLASDVPDTGSHTWTVPGFESSWCRIRVTESGGATSGMSPTFSISYGPDAYEPDGDPTRATPLVVNGPAQDHSLHAFYEEDWFSVEIADTGVTYCFETYNLNLISDTWLELCDTDGATFLTYNDDHYDYDSRVEYNFDSPGTYYLKVQSYSPEDETGVYTIRAYTFIDAYEPDDDASEAGTIQAGAAPQVRTLPNDADADWVKLEVEFLDAAKTFYITTRNLSPGLDTYLELFDTDGTTLLAENDNLGNELNSFIAYNFGAPGTYFIRVSFSAMGDPNYTGAYELAVEKL